MARYARGHGPFVTADLAQRYGLGVAVVTGALRRLAAEGRIAEGEFLPGRRGTAVVRHLGAAHAAPPLPGQAAQGGRAGAAVGAGPVPARLAERGPVRSRAGPPGQGRGRAAAGPRASADTVYEAIDQLAGAAMPASALETLILPGRVPGYQPAMLDELTAAGEVVWAGAGGLPGGDGWVALAPADTAPLLLPAPGEITLTPLHEAVLAALDGGGGMFFRMLADRAAALLPTRGRREEATDAAVAAAIWDLVWAGRITNDTLAALRTVLGTRPAGGRRRRGEPAPAGPAPPRCGPGAAAAAAAVSAARPCRPGPGRPRSPGAGRWCRPPTRTPPGGCTRWPGRCWTGTGS